jgi:hypothetical protein
MSESLIEKKAETGTSSGTESGETTPTLAQRPDELPEKFWDVEAGAPRVDAMAKSYAALESRLSEMVKFPGDDADPADMAEFRKRLGVPENAEGYKIKAGENLLESDPEVNKQLHEAGFTSPQAQLVYDLARDKVMPMIEQAAAEFEATKQTERLERHFGGGEKWEEVSRQLRVWGRMNMPEHVVKGLATTYEGVLTLHQMMKSGEPGFVRDGEAPSDIVEEAELKKQMNDPAYWRDRDPAVMKKVAEGFERLYGDKG